MNDIEMNDISVHIIREHWKKGDLSIAVKLIKKFLQNADTTEHDKLNVISTMINDCYKENQRQVVANSLELIYNYLQNANISYSTIKDILTSIIRIRSETIQNANNLVFGPFINTMIRSGNVKMAWNWITDSLEFARPATQELLWSYLTNWITNPPFAEDMVLREKCQYQILC